MQHFAPAKYPDSVSFFMLSRLLKCKGVREYLEAADIVKREYPNTKFYLLGKIEHSMQDAIPEEQIMDYVNRGVVELFPETSDVRPYYEMSSVFVLPSYREGVPRTTMEAMAMARPIITSDANGCKETIKDGVNGFMVPKKDSQAVADAMKKFLEDPTLVQRMGEESLKYCAEKFDVKLVNEVLCRYLNI